MRVLDLAAAKRRAGELIDAAELGQPIDMSDLVAIFGATACFELFLRHRQDPSDARFVRASLDRLLNLDYVVAVEIKPPLEIACTLCKERGRIVEHDRQVICPRCAGKGKHYPPDTDTIVVLYHPTTGSIPPPPTTINFSKEDVARDFFERVATRVDQRPAGSCWGQNALPPPAGESLTHGLTPRGGTLVPTPGSNGQPGHAPGAKPLAPAPSGHSITRQRGGIGGPVSSRTPWNDPPDEGPGTPPAAAEPGEKS